MLIQLPSFLFKAVTAPSWPQHPFLDADNRSRVYAVPIKDIRNLNVTFPIPDLQPHYRTGPGHYLGHLIGHEGKGSLLSELKSRGWVNSLVGGQKSGSKVRWYNGEYGDTELLVAMGSIGKR